MNRQRDAEFQYIHVEPGECAPDFRSRIDVSPQALARLEALYAAGYFPASAGLHQVAACLQWGDCRHLDKVIAWNALVRVTLPDGETVLGTDLIARVDFSRPRATRIDDLVILPRRDVPEWWRPG